MVRDYISEHGGEWEEIITAPSFQERFTVGGSALKNVPAGYEKEHPQAEYLKIRAGIWNTRFRTRILQTVICS